MTRVIFFLLLSSCIAFASCNREDMFGYALDPVEPPSLSLQPGDFFEPSKDFDCIRTGDGTTLFYTEDGTDPKVEETKDKGLIPANKSTKSTDGDQASFRLEFDRPVVNLRALCAVDHPSIKFSKVVGGQYRIMGTAVLNVTVTLPDGTLTGIQNAQNLALSYQAGEYIDVTVGPGFNSHRWYLNGMDTGHMGPGYRVGCGMPFLPMFQTFLGNLDGGNYILTVYAQGPSGFLYSSDLVFKVVP